MKSESQEDNELRRVENRTGAAKMRLSAKMEEYMAILAVGSPRDREKARNEALYATEALLDLQEEHICAILVRQGIDPMTRHLRHDGE